MGKATHGLIKENPMQQFTFKVYPNGRGRDVYRIIRISGSDTLDTSVLDPSEDKGNLAGKTWLFYVEFSTEPLE